MPLNDKYLGNERFSIHNNQTAFTLSLHYEEIWNFDYPFVTARYFCMQ